MMRYDVASDGSVALAAVIAMVVARVVVEDSVDREDDGDGDDCLSGLQHERW